MTIDAQPAYIDQPAIIWQAKKKKRSSHSRANTTALVVGAIILMDGGTACRVVAFTASGDPICTFFKVADQ